MDRIGQIKPLRWYTKEWRLKKGLTLQQVADRLDKAVGMISDLENGKRRMNEDWMIRLAYALGLDSPQDLLRDPKAPTMADLLAGAAPEDRELIINFAERLKRAG